MGDKICISKNWLRLGFFLFVVGAIAATVAQKEDIQRYLRIRSM